jgi:PAS domain S-box-containing protein
MSDQATKTQNAVLKELINGSWNAIGIISLESKFIYINKAFAPVLGYSESEILKLKLIDMMIPKYKTPFNNLLKENIENQYKNRITVGCLRKDNQIVYLDIVIKLMSNNKMFVINASDVTADVAEQKLINKFIVQYHMDKDGKILKTSDAFNRLSGNSSTELIFTSYIDLLHSSNNEDIKNDFITHINAHKPWKGNLILKKHDGSPFYVDFISKPSKNKYGDVLGHTAVMMDISSEIKLQKNEEILQEKVSDGEERLAIISDTMRTVAHEWRQPLNTISLDAQALLFDLDFDEEISKDNMHDKLTSISEHTQDLSSIIKNFQEITELKGSKKKRNIKDILLEAIKISDLYEKEFVKEDYQETTSFRTYPKELSLAISSILINAKEITANKEDRVINIVTSQKDNTIICEISNNGGHIPEDIMDKIFTPYFSTKEEKNGVGLSLYNCKIIIELHLKGTIKVENLGEDTVMFRLTFPMGALD